MRQWTKRPAFLVALLVGLVSVALIGVACGGDDDEADTPPPPAAAAAPTKAPVALQGTIPGSKLTLALVSIGKHTTETLAQPMDGCRPGCLVVKEHLFRMSPERKLEPQIVKEWDFGSDLKHWTLTMRDDILFHNGRPADAEDMEWSIFGGLYTSFRSGSIRAAAYQTASSRITGDYTVEIDFQVPTAAVAETSLSITTVNGGLFPRDEIEAAGGYEPGWEEFLKAPFATGAYKYVRQVKGERNEYEVFTDWWDKPGPAWERVVMLEVPEASVRLALLSTEGADVATLASTLLPQVKGRPEIKVLTQPSTVQMQVYFPNLWPEDHPAYDPNYPFQDARVREAFSISVNRKEIINTLYQGLSERHDVPLIALGSMGWDHPLGVEMRNNPIPFDPVRANQLLDEANFPRDLTLQLSTRGAMGGVPEYPEFVEAVQNQWIANLGLNVVITQGDGSKIGKDLRAGNPVVFHLIGSHRNTTEPLINVKARYWGPESVNYSPRFWPFIRDKLLELNSSENSTEIERLAAEISKYARDNWLLVPLTTNPLFYGVLKDKVGEWPQAPGGAWAHYIQRITATPEYRQAQ